jgi:hypothetical protein
VLSERFRILSESAANPVAKFEKHIADNSLFIIFSSGRPFIPAQGIGLCDRLHSGLCDPVYTHLCDRLYTGLCERLYIGLCERLYTLFARGALKRLIARNEISQTAVQIFVR